MAEREHINNFSPFDDPSVRSKQRITARASYKAFNCVANRLVSDLLRLFPTDATLRFIVSEFSKLAEDKTKFQIPARTFFREIRKDKELGEGKTRQFVDLLVEHDESAFDEPVPVMIISGIGLGKKWKTMDDETKQGVWQYVDRLVHLSAQAVFSGSSNFMEKNELSRAIVNAAISGKTAPEQIATDPLVVKNANTFVDSLK